MTSDARILSSLFNAGEKGVSGAELALELGVSRAAVWGRIQEMRRLGYDIEASPHQGYRLTKSPDLLLADDLQARLGPGALVGRDIRVFEETTSTNDIVEKMAQDGVKEGVVVFAESQTSGRGRMGRTWASPRGQGLWFSILLRPRFAPESATRVTIAAAAALAQAIARELPVRPEIKWPNDLLLGRRKLAGILTELSADMDQVRYLILGVGLNVNAITEDFPPSLRPIATSLRIELGRRVERPPLAAEVLRCIDRNYQRLCAGGFEAIAEEWETACSTLGKEVTIQLGDRTLRGRAESLDPDGALLLRTQHGRLERVTGGVVALEGSGR